jgi:hypothetical protein
MENKPTTTTTYLLALLKKKHICLHRIRKGYKIIKENYAKIVITEIYL